MPVRLIEESQPSGGGVRLMEDAPTVAAPGLPMAIAAHQQGELGNAMKTAATESAIPAAGMVAAALAPEAAAGAGLGMRALAGAGRVVAAGGGGAFGDLIRRGANKILGLSPLKDTEPVLDTMKRSFAEQAGNELVGMMASKALNLGAWAANKALAPLGKAMDEAANRFVRETSDAYGFSLTAPEIANSRAGKAIQYVGESRLSGNPAAQARRLDLYTKALGAVNRTLDDIGPAQGPLQMGQTLQDAREIAEQNWRATEKQMFSDFAQKSAAIPVKLEKVKGVSAEVLNPPGGKDFPNLLGPDPRVNAALSDFLDKPPAELPKSITSMRVGGKPFSSLDAGMQKQVLKDVAANQPNLDPAVKAAIDERLAGPKPSIQVQPMDRALAMRSDLLARQRRLDPAKDRYEIGQIGKAVDALEGSVRDSLKTSNPQLLDDWDAARQWTRDGHEFFQSSLMGKLADKNPEALAGMTNLQSPTDIALVKKMVVDYGKRPDAWEAYSRNLIQSKIIGGPNADGFIELNKIAGNLRAADPEALKLLVNGNPKAAMAIQNLGKMGDALERVKVTSPAPSYVQNVYASSDVNQMWTSVISFAIAPAAGISPTAAKALVPAVIAKIAYNPAATRYMLDGLEILGKHPRIGNSSGAGVAQVMRAAQIVSDVFSKEEQQTNANTEAIHAQGIPAGGVQLRQP
jgi:hypothetical protein